MYVELIKWSGNNWDHIIRKQFKILYNEDIVECTQKKS